MLRIMPIMTNYKAYTPTIPTSIAAEYVSAVTARRTTLSYRGFRTLATSKVFLLFLGEGKREALKRVLSGEDPKKLPVSFFITESFDSTIITDLKE